MHTIYRVSLLAVWLGVLLALSLGVQAAPSVPSTQQLAQQERFQLPNPMSREYMQVRRTAPVRYKAPVEVEEQTPSQPRPMPYTN